MGRWQHARAAAVGGAAVVVVWAVVALAAPAQNPVESADLKFFPRDTTPAPKTEQLPPLVVPDENIGQVQFQQRVPGASGQPSRTATNVPDPPYPVVTVRVRVPADAAPGDDLKYVITVQNVSAADAHSVSVRNPLTAEVQEVVKAEPKPSETSATQLVWNVGTLKAGKSQTIELTLRHKENVKELKNLAYVRYEHGQAVTTKIGKPTVKVTKSAPKQTVWDETYTVRVLVENQGKVPAENVRVLENVPQSAEVEPITAGSKRVTLAEGQQWVWEVARLLPGERKVFEYRVTPREAKDVFTLTSVTGSKLIADKPAEARTQVLVPGLEVKLTGPGDGTVVNPGESAKYEIVVRNIGTLPSTNIKVTATRPSDCKPTMMTNGGNIYGDSVVWQIARLEPGDSQLFRYGIKANTTGRRVVAASASDARGARGSQELATTFSGTAALVWETEFNPLTVQVGKQGVFTVRVKNHGGEAARNVQLLVDVPDNVKVVQSTPNVPLTNALRFGAESIPGYGKAEYTVTFEGLKADQAWFKLRLTADYLKDRPPMQTEKMVEIISGPK